MPRLSTETAAASFAGSMKALGFKVYLAKSGTYGFITDDKAGRVLSFSFTDGGSLSGNYGPPSRECGTGWRLEQGPGELRTREDVRRALYATPPHWCRGWQHYTTVEQHLAVYGASSGFVEV